MKTAQPFQAESYQLHSGRLRRLAPADAAILGEKMAAMDPWLTLGYQAEGLVNYMQKVDSALFRFVAEVGANIAGVACVRYPWLKGALLELFAVMPEFQNRGLGRELIQWVSKESGKVSPNLWSTVTSFNHDARAFYRRCGFAEITTLKDLVKPGYDEILIRRPIIK